MVLFKIGLKLSPFCKKYQIFQRLGALPPDLEWSLAVDSAITPPKQTLIADFWLRAWLRYFNCTTLACWCFWEFQILSKYRNITNNLKTHLNIITNFGRIVRFWKWHIFLSKTKNISNLTLFVKITYETRETAFLCPFYSTRSFIIFENEQAYDIFL